MPAPPVHPTRPAGERGPARLGAEQRDPPTPRGAHPRARVLVVGVGGLGCPSAMALARAGVGALGLCDDDDVERSNLHRQTLFRDIDVGVPKVQAAARALAEMAPALEIQLHAARLLPENALDFVSRYDLVVEGSDNFATKFLTADACFLAHVPVVHASAVRWMGTALAVGSRGRPCYRCLFEDMPAEGAPSCAQAGVMGPALGIVAAVQVDMALALLDGGAEGIEGQLATFDGRDGAGLLRRRALAARTDCALCGERPRIVRIDANAYVGSGG